MCTSDSHRMDSKTWAVPQSNTLMRSHFARTGMTPTVAQIRENLGSLLADALFASIPPELRECIGLEPAMKGPINESMWCSPSEQLLGKLKLTVIPSERHAHAITHNAILEIGGEIEDVVNRIKDRELQEKLEEQQRLFEEMLEQRVQEVRKKIIREFYELSSLKMRALFNQMEADFKEEWKKRETYLLTEAEKERVEGIRLLEEAMKCELENVTRLHEDRYTSQLKFLVDWEKSQAHEMYQEKLMRMQKKWSELFQKAREAAKVTSRAQMAQLQACHESELWSMITKEREYADQVLCEVVKFGKSQLMTLDEEINRLKDKFADACGQRDELADDVEAWKCVLRDLFNQFQKFITFVLKEIPGQAGYLLSLSEIMKNRKECLPRIRKDVDAHQYMSYQKQPVESWEDILVQSTDRAKETSNLEWKSQVDLDDEDDDRRKKRDEKDEEEMLKELAAGKQRDECIALIKNLARWAVDKIDNIQVTPSVSSLGSSSASTEKIAEKSRPIIVDNEILQYVEQLEKSLPVLTELRESQKQRLESMLEKMAKKRTDSVNVVGDKTEVLDPCPDPFVAKRINSILNILDAHPNLKKVLNDS